MEVAAAHLGPLRVLVVDDTITYRSVVSSVLGALDGVEVVGSAPNGKIALEKVERLRPDLLTLDLEMPEMDGLQTLRKMRQMPHAPGAIMLSSLTQRGVEATMEALSLGAFDFVLKPNGTSVQENAAQLRDKLRPVLDAFSRQRQIRKILSHAVAHEPAAAARLRAESLPASRDATRAIPPRKPGFKPARINAVVLGISTGGPPALNRVIPSLPADLAAPVLIVQHMPPIFTRSLADDLNRRSPLHVMEATSGQAAEPGSVLIAPGGHQMRVERQAGSVVVRITDDPPENSCRPSVDYLFRSAAAVYGENTLGIIMTGMGSDGTEGCRHLKRCGATVLVQDQATCVVYGMPRGPAEEGTADIVASLLEIPAHIVRLVGQGVPACR